jgi:hypothetical protein
VVQTTRGGAPNEDIPLAAISFAVLATVFLTLGDVAAKELMITLPAVEVAWMRYIIFCLLVVPRSFGR